MIYLTFQNFNMTHETTTDLVADLKVNLREVIQNNDNKMFLLLYGGNALAPSIARQKTSGDRNQ